MRTRLVLSGVLMAVVAACSAPESQGTEGAPCFPNGTCMAGLTCLSHLCVNAGPLDGGGPGLDGGPHDAGSADAGPTDAGPVDAGQPFDAGSADAGPTDAGPVDAGQPFDGGPVPVCPITDPMRNTPCTDYGQFCEAASSLDQCVCADPGWVCSPCPSFWPTSGDTCLEPDENSTCRYATPAGNLTCSCSSVGLSAYWNCTSCPTVTPDAGDPCTAGGAVCPFDDHMFYACVGTWVYESCPVVEPSTGDPCSSSIGIECGFGTRRCSCSAQSGGSWLCHDPTEPLTDAGLLLGDGGYLVPDGGQCSPPSVLHAPRPDAGPQTLFCPYAKTALTSAYCDPVETHCCEPSWSGTSVCEPVDAGCPVGTTDWRCEDPIVDCPFATAPSCCGAGALGIGPPGCANLLFGFTGTECESSCQPGEVQLCTADAECPNGEVCLPVRARGNQFGVCH